jgi:hypothetical protein
MKDISTIQALLDGIRGGWQRERADTQMTLGKMISRLKEMHSIARVEGLEEPHSYRGYYEDLAFQPTGGFMRVGELLDLCSSAMGKAYEGYKGGTYVMGEHTPVWVAYYGHTGKRIIAINSDDGSIETANEEE